tara:strand:- start:322 stop:771 length:450 start_codon:yes stop_codon:yes gene_type:complete
MRKTITLVLLFFFSLANVSLAENTKFLSLKNDKVNVRYGPSLNFPIKFIYNKKFLPIKIIDSKENFRRIIDHKKNSGWIHISQLRKANSIIVLEDKIVFKKNSKFSKPLVKLEKGRLIQVKKCISNWCKIKTENYLGWLQNNDVWGLSN